MSIKLPTLLIIYFIAIFESSENVLHKDWIMNKTVTLANLKIIPHLAGITFKPLETFSKLIKKYGNVLQLKFGNDSILVVNQPDVIKHILKTNQDNYPRGKAIDDLSELFGEGLLNSEESVWNVQRKLLTPAFHNSQLESFFSVFEQESDEFSEMLAKNAAAESTVDLEFHLKILLMKLTFRNLFSPDFKFDFQKLYSELNIILKETTFKKHNTRLVKSILTKKKHKLFSQNHTSEALAYITTVAETLFNDAKNGKIKTGGMLQLLVAAVEEGKTKESTAIDEIKNVIFAGSDTVANGILWLLYFIDRNKSYKLQVQKEIEDIKEDELSSPAVSRNIPILQAGIKETLRLMPPVWSFFRTSIAAETIEGYNIPKGAFIMISPFLLHRTNDFWNEPLSFKPERFLNREDVEQFNYLPFGQGKHICIGNRLAQIEILLLAIYLLKRFEFNFILPTDNVPLIKDELIITSEEKVSVLIKSLANN